MTEEEPKGPSKLVVTLSTIMFAVMMTLALVFLYGGPIADSPSLWRRDPAIFYPSMSLSALVFAVFTVMGIRRLRSM